eukprot:788944-Prorocentrum_lima.AAC.1
MCEPRPDTDHPGYGQSVHSGPPTPSPRASSTSCRSVRSIFRPVRLRPNVPAHSTCRVRATRRVRVE